MLDSKWDFAWDCHVKFRFRFNYDNKSAASGSAFDYILTSVLGWEFD